MIIVTNHAKERWITRIISPEHYSHLNMCTGCEKCTSLIHDINSALKMSGNGISNSIRKSFANAEVVNDPHLLEAIEKHYPGRVMYRNKNAVFVTKTDGEKIVIVSIMSFDMLDGTLIRTKSKQEISSLFKRWKFESRHKGCT